MTEASAVTPVTTHSCDKCGKVFYTEKALRIHHARAHDPYRPANAGYNGRLKPITIHLPESYYEQLRELSRLRGETVSRPIRRAVSELITAELPIFQGRGAE